MCIRDSLYTGRVNAEVVNLLLENARFAELTYRISQYFDDTFASGIAAQNAMLTTLSTLLRTKDVYKRQELDYLIYNDPLGYADLILNGDPEEYLKKVAGSHGLED